jgi:hypothetical protein
MFSFASWNIRGLNRSPKQMEVQQIVKHNKLSLCAILESHVDMSKLVNVCNSVFKSWDWTSNGNHCLKGARIIIGWNPNLIDVMVLSQSDQVLHLQLVLKADKKLLFASVVYADNYYVKRRDLWDSLCLHKLFVGDRPWVLFGDFNATLFFEDHSAGPSVVDVNMRDFRECVEKIEVVDINSSGLNFTWSQKPKNGVGILKKLDRVLANTAFTDLFPSAYALFQPYRLSDHCPCILKIPAIVKQKPKPFKFANFLLYKEGFFGYC